MAVKRGAAVPLKYLPYARQTVTEDDIEAVVEILRSDWLTTGPAVERFEDAIGTYVGSHHAVAVSSGTAALHAAMHALEIGPGDEVVVPPMTFAATANAVIYCGGTPIFADVQPGSLLLDPARVAEKISARTRAILAVDYAGQPCDYDELRKIAEQHNLALVADACHSLGATYKNRAVGTLADLTVFSFHPVKHITTGEGGMVVTNDARLANRVRIFRNHGITSDHKQRSAKGSFYYEMVELGYNYRITDFQCALGTSQLHKLPAWLKQRQDIARDYADQLRRVSSIRPLEMLADRTHAYHLYVVRLPAEPNRPSRDEAFSALREQNIGANVHYLPVHLHPFYRKRYGYGEGLCRVAEAAYREILSLPIHPQMRQADVARVVDSTQWALKNG